MKRFALWALLALSLSVFAAPALGDNSGTGCVGLGGWDIVRASVNYGGPGNENAVTGGPSTATASCKDVTFTMTVVGYNADGTSLGILGVAKSKGSGDTFVGQLTVSGVTAPNVCVYFTSFKGSTVWDIAPNDMCPPAFDPNVRPGGIYEVGGGSGAGGFPYQ